MGDRALIIFKHGEEYSPTIYLHWMGESVPELLEEHRALMGDRDDDLSYAAARFVGVCASKSPNRNTGIGMWNTDTADVETEDALAKYSHGDAGVVVVFLPSFKWTAYGGYLANPKAA